MTFICNAIYIFIDKKIFTSPTNVTEDNVFFEDGKNRLQITESVIYLHILLCNLCLYKDNILQSVIQIRLNQIIIYIYIFMILMYQCKFIHIATIKNIVLYYCNIWFF